MGVIPAGEDVLRDSDGVAVQRAEAIMNRSDFEQIGRMLEANAGKAGPRMNASPLLHVAHCGRCGSVLYTSQVRSVLRSGAKVYMYYQCGGARQGSGCGERKVRAELLEELTESAVLGALADVPRRVKVVTPAEDHSAELASVTEAIINLEGDRYDRGLFPGEDGAARYAEIMTRLQARQAALRALPSRDEKVEWPETGETFGQYWDALTEPERHQYLRSSGVRVSVLRADAGLDQEVTLNLSGRIEEADLDRPWEDVVRNRSVMIFRHGLRVDVDLGDLAVLRERAALAS
jgi:site-specific DNA recombinase